ncbi:hypothetical protein QBC46DRAFT_385225 [Diplogelasinospora grovesii]|uniref:L-ascorbic acid binding protein n=1 Tax=Diplogelasinospora grovesii TaxID=303347 RepID=A0AAN6N7A5_9PEZI|nr:hypothetical protein QBC46DRAFT_385225 [Diplogelasinospora grovesii]
MLRHTTRVASRIIMTSSAAKTLRFKEAMRIVYGPFNQLSPEEASAWVPPDNPGAGGHRGRYLWTDAFGVVNFITLSQEEKISSPNNIYLTLARRLVGKVHDVLGRTRDGSARLFRATDAEPLAGGLRIGKVDADGPDGDGQYHHYLTLWMFALNRLAIAAGDYEYNRLAVQLAKAIHPHFVVRDGQRGGVRMYWKMSTDLKTVLVPREGHLDAATGYVVYKLLQRTAKQFSEEETLDAEIADYRSIMDSGDKLRPSGDALDLGMCLWMCHFFRDEEEWARELGNQSLAVARVVLSGFMARSASHRLAFREFGACMGLKVYGVDDELAARVDAIVDFWQKYLEKSADEDLRPISLVMYAAALIPGAFQDGYLKT